VHEAAAMQRPKRAEHGQHHRHGVSERKRAAGDPTGEGLALEQFHRNEQLAIVFADFMNLADSRMGEAGGGARFPPEALASVLIHGARMDHFQRDLAAQSLVASAVDHAHAALAELARNAVPADLLTHCVYRGPGF